MPVEIIDATGKLIQIKIRGKLKKADYDRIIEIAREAIAREGKVRALAILEGFEGWERHDDWGDVSFMTEQGRHLEKMAMWATKNGATTRWLLPPKGFVRRPSNFFRPHV
jgi:hypothetical protein